MEQTILLSREENMSGELPFTIVNKKPVFSADEELKIENMSKKNCMKFIESTVIIDSK